jgi:hypothetical protein
LPLRTVLIGVGVLIGLRAFTVGIDICRLVKTNIMSNTRLPLSTIVFHGARVLIGPLYFPFDFFSLW